MKINYMIILLVCIQPLNAYHIFWDLSNVLIKCDRVAMGKDLGLFNVLKYTTQDRKNPLNLPKMMQTILATFGKQHPTSQEPLVCVGNDDNDAGDELGQISCDFFTGKIDYTTLKKEYTALLDSLEEEKYFSSATEKKLLIDLFDLVHEPHNIVRYREILKKGLDLLKKVIAHTHGEHQLYIMANWDAESFALLQQAPHVQELISLFKPENIVISGLIGTLKPHARIFEYALEKYHLNPADCILIDDSKDNIAAAQRAGFTGIHITRNNFAQAEQQLKQLNLV